MCSQEEKVPAGQWPVPGGKGRVEAPAEGKTMVAAKEKVDQQVSHVALCVRDGRVEDERPFMPHASAGVAPLGLD